MNWTQLLSQEEIEQIFPKNYAWLVPLVHKALVFFLSKLPKEIQTIIIFAQAQLGPSASIYVRLVSLAKQSPVLHKLGQVLARDKRITPGFRQELQKLEWLRPSIPAHTLKNILESEFGILDEYGIKLAEEAVAEASVAVVIPFSYDADGSLNRGKKWSGVFKILKPGVSRQLEVELSILQEVGEYLDKQNYRFDLPKLDYEDTFEHVAQGLRCEVLLDKEQANLKEAGQVFSAVSGVKIPKLFSPCSDNVTAMEWISGQKLDAKTLRSYSERLRMASIVTRALIASPVFNRKTRSIFHGDPHAGNLFRTSGGRLGLLDWSLVGYLGKSERSIMSRICLAAASFQDQEICLLIERLLGREMQEVDVVKVCVSSSLLQIRNGRPPGFSWLVELLDAIAFRTHLQLPQDLVLFRKALLSLSGQLEELTGNDYFADFIVLQYFSENFSVEWLSRWQAGCNDRDFATHLSNMDLLNAFTNTWLQPWQTVLGINRKRY